MAGTTEADAIETLRRRFKARVGVGLSLARAYRFVVELEPFVSDGPDPFDELAAVFKGWRLALRDGDVERALDAVERTWSLLDACRHRVTARDAAIEAFRVRWACENAYLRHQTIDSLARFYRLLPYSTSSQSKYEYVLTRRLAGPIGPERKLAPTGELKDAVRALEISWGASPVEMDEREARTTVLALKSFAHEADGQADAASFTASALLRRFSSFKMGLGALLFDPRVSVAVVETNVAVLNVLNQLLADAGGQPLRGSAAARTARQIRKSAPPRVAPLAEVERPIPAAVQPAEAPPAVLAPPAEDEPMIRRPAGRDHPNYRTSEIDLSGLDLVPPPLLADDSGREEEELRAEAPPTPAAATEAAVPARPDLRTGEVDLSGLEFVRRILRPKMDAPEVEGEPESVSASETPTDDGPAAGAAAMVPTPAPIAEAEQQPSVRAFELGKLEENAALIERYLAWPRSPEVWQLDLDVFLGPSHGGPLSQSNAAERRRALDLILTADDLICARAIQDEAPSAEHRAQVKAVANAMLLLRTALRKNADSAEGDATELESLLYVADHLLWERLRLEASLKRKPSRQRPPLLPRTAPAAETAEAALLRTRTRIRHRRILVRIVAVAATLTTIAGLLSTAQSRAAVDPEVRQVDVAGLPGAALFDDARAYRTTLFVSAGRTWVLLGREERRSIVSGLGDFAAERGYNTVSVIGPLGEPWATFEDDEVLLDGELTAADLAKR